MASNGDVKFIRRHGKVIPIRQGTSPGRGHHTVTPMKKSKATTGDVVAGGTAAGVGGGLAGKHFIARGSFDMRGVERVYHGTSREAAASIRKVGLKTTGKTTHAGGMTVTGFAFVSKDKASTGAFSKVAQAAHTRGKAFDVTQAADQLERTKAGLFGKKGEVLKFDIPKSVFANRFTTDPENLNILKHGGQLQDLHKSRFVTSRTLNSKYIAGNMGLKKDIAMKVRQAAFTFRTDKMGFAKGAGKTALGVGLAVGGAYLAYKAAQEVRSRFKKGSSAI